MITLPAGRFAAQKLRRQRGIFVALFTCFVASLVVPAHGQLTWMRSDKKGAVPAGSGTKVRLRIPAGDKFTFYTTGFPPITLSAPGVTAKVSLTVTIEGDIAAMGANNTRFFGLGLFNSRGTLPGNNFADDSGYYFTMKGSSVDSGFIEMRKRLGNGKSPTLNPAGEARANIGGPKDVQSPGTITEKVPYSIVFRLARKSNGISFGESREMSAAGVTLVGGGASISTYSSEPDANPESTTFDEFGIFLENRSSTDAYIDLDSLQLELRKDGELLSETTRPSLTVQPADVLALVGTKISFSSEATGGSLSYQWKRNKVNIPGAVGSSYTVEEAQPDDSGGYTVEVTNPYGSVESTPATLRLKQMISLKPDTPPVEQIVYDEDSVDEKPTFRKMPKIRYPSALRQRTIKGTTIIRFVVTTEGYLDSIQFVKYADRDLIEPLMNAYQKARYKPATKNGKSVCSRVTVSIPYETP